MIAPRLVNSSRSCQEWAGLSIQDDLSLLRNIVMKCKDMMMDLGSTSGSLSAVNLMRDSLLTMEFI